MINEYIIPRDIEMAMRGSMPMSLEKYKEYKKHTLYWHNSRLRQYLLVEKIYNWVEKNNIPLEELNKNWIYFWKDQTLISREYNKKPIRRRQDNKTEINYGSGYSERGYPTIRYPRKCRKTAWKRFYKLFPKLKP